MLTELRVRDLAVIADVTLPLNPGLNVLTGETGAGKSMLVDALALLLGERASADLVRPGAERAVIEAAFQVEHPGVAAAAAEAGVDLEDGRLVIRREIRVDGRNRAWANGSPTTVGVLADLGRRLVDLHGQHESQSLLKRDCQRDILDAFADAASLGAAVGEAYRNVSVLRAELDGLDAREAEVCRRADYLRHVVDEITRVNPGAGEDEALAAESSRLAHAEELTRLAEELALVVDGEEGLVERIGAADRLRSQLERIDPGVGGWRDLLDGLSAQADELARAVRAYAGNVEMDPDRLAQVEQRRDAIYRVRQKYGPSIEDVLRTAGEAARDLDLLDTAALDRSSLAEQLGGAEAGLRESAELLSAVRRKAATRLASEVQKLLPGLGLSGGKFTASVDQESDIGPNGADRIAFLVQLNVGLDARPLAQVASGGELSRLMLALKVVLARHDAIPTLVFDEVDQGVGAEVGVRVAEALGRVASQRQVLVITHLAPIAARSVHHLKVEKHAKRGITTASVRVLSAEEREIEVARLLGDADDRSLREHAAELLRRSPPATVGG